MSVQSSAFTTAPSDKDTPTQDRGIFNHEAQKHQSHHYLRMYGGQAVQAAMWGFGATLGADAANAVVGDARNCRFHFYYALEDEGTERDWVDFDEEESIGAHIKPDSNIPFQKAFWMYWQQRRQTFCEGCRALMIPDTNKYQRCRCTLFDNFVGKRWLCLPCFFLEESKLHKSRTREYAATSTVPLEDTEPAQGGYVRLRRTCDGKSDEMCRVCNGATGWYRDRDVAIILPKILAQLG
ncbi:hypothetical protein LTR85_005749 [Meristemomyces frigidus]|nr:hypothetical protein LTR85_005749 [Meristemomyces frigidus]